MPSWNRTNLLAPRRSQGQQNQGWHFSNDLYAYQYSNQQLAFILFSFWLIYWSSFGEKFQDSPSTTRKTGGQPSKLVDLGAAAAFAQQSTPPQPQAAQQSGSGLLVGDLHMQQQQQSTSSGGFADFESAFTAPSEESQSAGEFLL